jgi:hypothetical protein
VREDFEERAAIMEFDGGLGRDKAEPDWRWFKRELNSAQGTPRSKNQPAKHSIYR